VGDQAVADRGRRGERDYDGEMWRRRIDWRAMPTTVAVSILALGASIVGVYVLEERAGVRDASTVFLLAVALVAYLRGSWAAVGTALGAFLAYNFLFLPPEFTFFVSDPQHILTLILLLTVGAGIGRLTGQQRDQARRSERREHEARALFNVSRAIATAKRMKDALPVLVRSLAEDARMTRVWIGLGSTWAQEQVVAASDPGTEAQGAAPHSVLRRASAEGEPGWVRLSPPGPPAGRRDGLAMYRIELADGTEPIGSLWAARDPRLGPPTGEETRLLAAAADQIGQGIMRDRLSEQATELEVARRSEELKAALLDSVSHDLRTPLATIRASAGTLADPSVALTLDDARATAREIDAEADRLANLVSGLLDMSRITGGALETRPETMPVSEVVMPALRRAMAALGNRRIELAIPDDLPPMVVDPVLVSQVLDNLLENVSRHTLADAPMRIAATATPDAVTMRVEDGGAGVPPEAMPHIFEKFYRVPARRGSARQGTGLGLAVVKGMAEAMGGSVGATRSELGGLAIDLRLPIGRDAPPDAEQLA
jgi:two-component system sensor histidine kinase KdpD